MPAKILIADDHPIVIAGVERLVQELDLKVAGVLLEPGELVATLRRLKPVILVSEIRLKNEDVIRLLEGSDFSRLGCQVVIFSGNLNPTNILRAGTIGCFDYIAKTQDVQQLGESLQLAAEGKPAPASSLLVQTKSRMKQVTHWEGHDTPLTLREKQVLQHVAMGLSNREIGRALGISVETVKEHVQNILRKLEANDRTQAAVWAVKEGLI